MGEVAAGEVAAAGWKELTEEEETAIGRAKAAAATGSEAAEEEAG